MSGLNPELPALMTHKKREKIIKKILQECQHIRNTKGIDYAWGTKDANYNFKRVAQELKLTPEQVCMVYLKKHMDTIYLAIRGEKLKGEALEEKIKDIINYLLILYTLLQENG